VHIEDGNEWRAAFRTGYGSHEFQAIHYGLTNAAASFQRFMNQVFKDILTVCVVVYLGDILIFFDNSDEHLKHVREVLRCLRRFKSLEDLIVKALRAFRQVNGLV
jgi:hypothetical protein